METLIFDQIDALASSLYAFLQGRMEEPDAHRLVSLAGNFGDANAYTQKMSREGVETIIKEWQIGQGAKRTEERALNDRIMDCLESEVAYIKRRFPTNKHQLASLFEEAGELAQALIDHDRGNATGDQVFREAIQTAAVAICIAENGSQEFCYEFDGGFAQKFMCHREAKEHEPEATECECDRCPCIMPSDGGPCEDCERGEHYG